MNHGGSSNRYQQVETLYQQAMDLPVERRAAFLESECDGDADLQSEVAGLIRHFEAAGDFLARPAGLPGAEPLGEELGGASVPQRIGPYRVLRLIGEGGMGTVYEAEQSNPRRRVAVKVIRVDLAGGDMLSRFRREIDALARLGHPGIAQIIESGMGDITVDGAVVSRRPYFAMEFVDGRPLREFADERKLDARARLELFAAVCDAVQHAHQKGVIHRDLKPANILVVEGTKGRRDEGTKEGPAHDSSSLRPFVPSSLSPKILDFGVARIAGADIDTLTQHTRAGQLLGTLAYMSPEQLAGDPHNTDTRSDVYALGVVAYELLTGRPPFDLAGHSLPSAIRLICDGEPTPPGAVRPELRGDVDAILRRATEKDPRRRYASAAELAADIRRHLAHEPVEARPPNAAYQLRKFARRNRGLVAGAALALIALLIGAIGTATFAWRESVQAHTAQENADRAQENADRAQAVIRFLRRMLASADPARTKGEDLTVREVLDEAGERIAAGELADTPLVEAALRVTIGDAYVSVGHAAKARPHLEAALEIHRRLKGPHDQTVAENLSSLAAALGELGQYEDAVRLNREQVDVAGRLHGESSAKFAVALGELAVNVDRAGRETDAEPLYRRAVPIHRAAPDADPLDLARMLSSFGACLNSLGKFDEAETILREALEIRRRDLPAGHLDISGSLNNLASVLKDRGKLNEAEALLREDLDLRRRTLGPGHPGLAVVLNNLAMLLQNRGKSGEAVPLLNEALDVLRGRVGPNHPDVVRSTLNLAVVMNAAGDREGAERLELEALQILRGPAAGASPDALAAVLHNMAVGRNTRGDLEDALPLLREALPLFAAAHGDDSPNAAHVRTTLGTVLNGLERFDDALPLLEKSLEDRRQAFGEQDFRVGLTRLNLALTRLGLGQAAAARDAAVAAGAVFRADGEAGVELSTALLTQAEAGLALGEPLEWRPLLDEALRLRSDKFGDDSWRAAEVRRVRGAWLAHEREYEAAEAELSAAFAIVDGPGGSPDPRRASSRRKTVDALVALCEAWGRPESAREWSGRR